jgi:nitroimidazol reductase NimA-like FMN-containing flavoprotein (pyridoxamine 5'-phosphate oxidase superfamily)
MKNRLITSEPELLSVIEKADSCVMAMVGTDLLPYAIPMNFGFHNNVVYLHSAKEGKKIAYLKAHPAVCLVFSTDHMLRYQNESVACSWSMKYRSVLIYGNVQFIDDLDERIEAMNCMMQKYSGKDFKFNMPAIREVLPFKVVVEKIEGRAYGY